MITYSKNSVQFDIDNISYMYDGSVFSIEKKENNGTLHRIFDMDKKDIDYIVDGTILDTPTDYLMAGMAIFINANDITR